MTKEFCVYILCNKTGSVLYTGVTSDLAQRIYQHKNKFVPGFTTKYEVDRLVYYEACLDAETAILREKQIKAGSRAKKLELIRGLNPQWKDLFDEL